MTLADTLAHDLRAAGASEVEVVTHDAAGTVKILSLGLPQSVVLRTLTWEATLSTGAAGRVLLCLSQGPRVIVYAKLDGTA